MVKSKRIDEHIKRAFNKEVHDGGACKMLLLNVMFVPSVGGYDLIHVSIELSGDPFCRPSYFREVLVDIDQKLPLGQERFVIDGEFDV